MDDIYGYFDGGDGSYYDQVDDYNFSNVDNEVDNYDFSNVANEVDDYNFDPGATYEIPNTAQEGQEGYGWRYFSDGTVIAPNGTYYVDGKPIWSPENGLSSLVGKLGSVFKDASGNTDWRRIASVAGGIAGASGLGGLTKAQDTGPKGYQGGIPEYAAIREQVPSTYDPNRRPGSGGRRYFSDMAYTPAGGIEAARTAAQEQAAGLAAINAENPANQRVTTTQQAPAQTAPEQTTTERPASAVIEDLPVPTYNQGGIAALKKGRYLRGETDGMSDELMTNIDGNQPAALSHGEFVIPADVVSHLGNGNSDAGAKKLYQMMDRIRQARTGTTKQGKQINPNKFLPKAR